jgi:hypothetical protein
MPREVVSLAPLRVSVESVLRFAQRVLCIAHALAEIRRPLDVARDVVHRQDLVDRVVEPRRDDREPGECQDLQAGLERGPDRRERAAEVDPGIFGACGV